MYTKVMSNKRVSLFQPIVIPISCKNKHQLVNGNKTHTALMRWWPDCFCSGKTWVDRNNAL